MTRLLKTAIRVDASIQIGIGHLMRCLTLADELKRNGGDVHFLCHDLDGLNKEAIRNRGHMLHLIPGASDRKSDRCSSGKLAHSAWLHCSQDEDWNECYHILNKFDMFDWVVVDHYALDTQWETKIRPLTKRLMVIDDLSDRVHDCDVLLDQNYYHHQADQYSDLVPPGCRMLIGPEYALLRPDFSEIRETLPPKNGTIQRIFIFLGGADSDNATMKALDAVNQIGRPDIRVDVVLGPANPHIDAIIKANETKTQIVFHQNVKKMAELMAMADLAIGAGGTATWERCCVGLPALIIVLADNQKEIAGGIETYRAGMNLGENRELTEHSIAEALECFIQQPELISEYSKNALKLVDGNGTKKNIPVTLQSVGFKMNVLFLGPENKFVQDVLETAGDRVKRYEKKILPEFGIVKWADFILSYGYRHILKTDILSMFDKRAVNLHISYLPWNRGADPNLWSFIDNTPKGVTIHFLDEGVDTGDILAQRKVEPETDDTLASSYQRLSRAIEELFAECWVSIREGTQCSKPQKKGGSYHCLNDAESIKRQLTNGWDTPVSEIFNITSDQVLKIVNKGCS